MLVDPQNRQLRKGFHGQNDMHKHPVENTFVNARTTQREGAKAAQQLQLRRKDPSNAISAA